jgi:hypothetical protein
MSRVKADVGATGIALIGFDFPIGIPAPYARLIGVNEFKPFLLQLGEGDWPDFYRICAKRSEVSRYRPFYPDKPGGTRHEYLLSALGLSAIDELRRLCDLKHGDRNAACPLFWTLGANQVGKGAIVGWQDVIAPALKAENTVRLWPFDGKLRDLLQPGNVVIVETYPAECGCWLLRKPIKGKRKLAVRKSAGAPLLRWAQSAGVGLDPVLRCAIEQGFPEGDDAFDAVVGLFGMLEVVLNKRPSGEPSNTAVSDIEGWILGQVPPAG